MTARVLAIGMDSADGELVERWTDAGHLRALARLRREGSWGRIAGGPHHRSEAPWTTLLTGCEPERTGYWTDVAFDPRDYRADTIGAYGFAEHPPFHALGEGRRVAVVDVPQTRPSPDVDGPQVIGWGAHEPRHPSCSNPPGLLDELVARHGPHPALRRDHATFWNPVAVARLRRALRIGARRRAAICADLLAREPWDLFLTAFSETHSAGHHLLQLSGDGGHPLYRRRRDDPLREVYRDVDRALGELVAAAGEDAAIVVFSPYGMEPATELPSLVFLPELCFRLSFPGRRALAPGGDGPPAPVMRHPRALTWERWLWGNRDAAGCEGLRSPGDLGELSYQPAMWFSDLWPRMRAFALPGGVEGYVRINLAGRERHGIVAPDRYEAVCAEIEGNVRGMRDPRTGAPIVRDVLRTRRGAGDDDPGLPDADLIVCWAAGAWDVVDTPVGRMGPVPFARTGTHVNRGFIAVRGPGAAPGGRLPDGGLADVTATILDLLGAPPDRAPDGRTLLVA